MEIKSKVKNFEVVFVQDFNFIKELLKIDHYIVITGKNVYKIYKDKIFNKFPKEKVKIIELGEENKTLSVVAKLYESLLEGSAKKNLTLISFGGGINQDVVGFTASTLYRGINWIYIPTTLLSMADSSIGSKTSLNFKNYKNVIGTFYPPSKIIINVDFLKTLSKLDYYSGIGEVIKLYMMKKNFINEINDVAQKVDRLLSKTNNNQIKIIINEAMKIKLSYMEGDEFDHGRRNLLNYGHEFGHALESASSFNIPHGTAVLIGIIFANCVSLKRNFIDIETFNKLNKLLLLPNILFNDLELKREYFNKEKILDSMKKDKKRTGKGLVLVLPSKKFSLIKINDLSIDEYNTSLIKLRKLLQV